MGKDVGSLIVSVSCGRRLLSELPLSMVLFYMGHAAAFSPRQTQASSCPAALCILQAAKRLECWGAGRKHKCS